MNIQNYITFDELLEKRCPICENPLVDREDLVDAINGGHSVNMVRHECEDNRMYEIYLEAQVFTITTEEKI